MKNVILYLVVAILTGFGLLTMFLSTSVIFDLFDVRAKEGNYVLFVVWSNFISSFLYLFSVYGLLTSKNWTFKILGLSTIILAIAFIGFLFYPIRWNSRKQNCWSNGIQNCFDFGIYSICLFNH